MLNDALLLYLTNRAARLKSGKCCRTNYFLQNIENGLKHYKIQVVFLFIFIWGVVCEIKATFFLYALIEYAEEIAF